MKLILIALGGFLIVLAVVLLIGSAVLNNRFDSRAEAGEFRYGQSPAPALDGAYKGSQFTGLGKDWTGKQFLADKNEGINNFNESGKTTQRYSFRTSQTTSLRDSNVKVLQLNYDDSANPFLMRFIRDEVVQVAPNKYLGKIQFKLGPVVVTLGYFRLQK